MHCRHHIPFVLTLLLVLCASGGPLRAQQEDAGTKAAKGVIRAGENGLYEGDGHEILMWQLFYHDQLASNAVRVRSLSLDSLPDEINLRLVRDSDDFCFPMRNIITSPYGWRERWQRPHRGVDILLRTGDPVRACFGGVVRIARPMGGYGNMVLIRHANGLETLYGHLSKILVKPRQVVKAGEVIALGGSTGRSTGPHLHFETRFQYEPFDPEWILDFKNYKLRTRRLHLDKTYFGISKPKGNKTPAFKADKSIIRERPERVKPREVYYEVKRGDTLERIAIRHNTTEERLRDLNPSLKRLKPGMRLRVR